MARRPRRNHSPAFKAKTAVAATKGEKTLSELAQQFDLHPNQVTRWRSQLLDGAMAVFGDTAKAEPFPAIDVQAQAKVRSMAQRLGCTTNPVSARLMISTGRGAAAATRGHRLPASAKMRSRKGKRRVIRSRTSAAPSRSCTLAEWTSMCSIRPRGVGDQVPLATLGLFSGVVSDHFAGLRAGLDALAVDDRRGRALVTALQLPAPAVEQVVEVRPDPGRDPGPEVAGDRAARWAVLWQHPPLAARLEQVYRVQHPSQAGLPVAHRPARPGATARSTLPPGCW